MTDWAQIGVVAGEDGALRCGWCVSAPDYVAYHDDEWGRPRHRRRAPVREGLPGGAPVRPLVVDDLRKRQGFRRAFAGFVPKVVAEFGPADVERLLADAGIVRHRGKIEATIATRPWSPSVW